MMWQHLMYVQLGHLSNGKVFFQRLFHTNQIILYSMRNFDTLLRLPVDSKAVKGDFVQLRSLMILSSIIFKKRMWKRKVPPQINYIQLENGNPVDNHT